MLDNRLADGTGTDLCRRLTAEFPALDVVMHAGVMTTAEVRAALEAGAAAVIQKSVRPDALIHAVLRSRHPLWQGTRQEIPAPGGRHPAASGGIASSST